MKLPSALTDNIAFSLNQTAKEYQVYFDQEMAELGLTRSQWLLLGQLYLMHGCNQKDLSDVMDIGKAALGRLVDKLEAKGWIHREPDEHDGRAYNLFITEPAYPLVGMLVDMLMEETERSLSGFSKKEIDQLKNYMARIRKNIQEVPPTRKWQRNRQQVLDGLSALE